jgi:hypothetical protein
MMMKIKLLRAVLMLSILTASSLQAQEELAAPPQKSWARQKYEELCARYPKTTKAAKATAVAALGVGAVGTAGYGYKKFRDYRRNAAIQNPNIFENIPMIEEEETEYVLPPFDIQPAAK